MLELNVFKNNIVNEMTIVCTCWFQLRKLKIFVLFLLSSDRL